MIYGKIINAVKNYNKTTAALDPFGGRNTPQENRKNAASRAAMMKDIQARNEQSNNMSAKSRGGGGSKDSITLPIIVTPTPEPQLILDHSGLTPLKASTIDDAEYLRDRRNIFNNNGNGWWWFTSGYVYGNKRRH